jgi:tRNA (adenine57-N1/adenine58-N1)-methyltransferase
VDQRRTKPGDLALLVSSDFKTFFIHLRADQELQTHRGIIQHNELIDVPWGAEIKSHLEMRYVLVEPTLRDLLLNTKRRSQIIYPKDIGYILLRLSIRPGSTVIEAGTGSGALTTALAWSVGDQGKVYSYDRREDMLRLASDNLDMLGLAQRVEFIRKDIGDGFSHSGADALFLDLPRAESYLSQARDALTNGGTFGAIVPTTNQVSMMLEELERQAYTLVDVCEIMLRFYKTVPQRLRPADRMVAHTGFLIFARAGERDPG